MILLEFESEIRLYDRLHDAAKSAGCTVRQVIRALLVEALASRDSAATIRQTDADAPFPSVLEMAETAGKVYVFDDRFCSLHCRHLDKGVCNNSNAVDGGTASLRVRLGHGWYASEHCPYTVADFERWQRDADEDEAEIKRLELTE